jgi:hypothetical protein
MIEDGDRRRDATANFRGLATGYKIRVVLKSALTPPVWPVPPPPDDDDDDAPGPVVTITPTTCEVYVVETIEDSTGAFKSQRITDEVMTVAVFDPTLPTVAEPDPKTGPYGHVEIIDGIPELTWLGCPV